MYDQLFTSAWIFDKCQEGSAITTIPFLVLWSLIFGIAIFYLFNKKMNVNKNLSLDLSVIGGIFFLPFSFFTIFIVGYETFNCAAHNRYWPLVEPAINLNGKLNHLYTYDMLLPKNEEELKNTFPDLYNSVSSNSKIKYYYNALENRYILAVRASKYNLHIFDSARGQANYRLGWASFFYDDVPKFEDQQEYGADLVPR